MIHMDHASPIISLKTFPISKYFPANHTAKTIGVKFIFTSLHSIGTQDVGANRTSRRFGPLPDVSLILLTEPLKGEVILSSIDFKSYPITPHFNEFSFGLGTFGSNPNPSPSDPRDHPLKKKNQSKLQSTKSESKSTFQQLLPKLQSR